MPQQVRDQEARRIANLEIQQSNVGSAVHQKLIGLSSGQRWSEHRALRFLEHLPHVLGNRRLIFENEHPETSEIGQWPRGGTMELAMHRCRG